MSKAGLSSQRWSVADRIREPFTVSVATAIDRFRKSARHCKLATLSDRQLRDAGIDLSLAGRGKAAAVSAATLRRLQSLSWG
jgi:uncharacterized protein YjiS (DUF1127 family)